MIAHFFQKQKNLNSPRTLKKTKQKHQGVSLQTSIRIFSLTEIFLLVRLKSNFVAMFHKKQSLWQPTCAWSTKLTHDCRRLNLNSVRTGVNLLKNNPIYKQNFIHSFRIAAQQSLKHIYRISTMDKSMMHRREVNTNEVSLSVIGTGRVSISWKLDKHGFGFNCQHYHLQPLAQRLPEYSHKFLRLVGDVLMHTSEITLFMCNT